jgi:hypothetical protein
MEFVELFHINNRKYMDMENQVNPVPMMMALLIRMDKAIQMDKVNLIEQDNI